MSRSTPSLSKTPRLAAAELRRRVVPACSSRATPVVEAAEALGYEVREFAPQEGTSRIDGAIQRLPKPVIFINSSQGRVRRRFTIAHELGHAVLHEEDLGRDGFIDYRGDFDYGFVGSGREADANTFAANLLMPQDVFESLWSAYDGSVIAVADALDVSRLAAEIRAKRLGLL